MTKTAKTFRYQSTIESEGIMYSDVKGVLLKAGVGRKSLFGIMLAVSEAFTNALKHGNKFAPDKKIEVSIGINGDQVVADIIDEGEGFADSSDRNCHVDLLAEGGRGVGLMRSIADEIRFDKAKDFSGTRVSMRFDLNKNEMNENVVDFLEDKMEVTRRDEGQVTVICLSGRLDLGNGNKLKEEVKGVLASGKTCIHLNLKGIEFVNSSGLGALVSIMKETRIHRGRLTLSDMADYVREIFDITQLSHIFEIFATEQEALHSYQPALVK